MQPIFFPNAGHSGQNVLYLRHQLDRMGSDAPEIAGKDRERPGGHRPSEAPYFEKLSQPDGRLSGAV
jgi:hypothetical protein